MEAAISIADYFTKPRVPLALGTITFNDYSEYLEWYSKKYGEGTKFLGGRL